MHRFAVQVELFHGNMQTGGQLTENVLLLGIIFLRPVRLFSCAERHDHFYDQRNRSENKVGGVGAKPHNDMANDSQENHDLGDEIQVFNRIFDNMRYEP